LDGVNVYSACPYRPHPDHVLSFRSIKKSENNGKQEANEERKQPKKKEAKHVIDSRAARWNELLYVVSLLIDMCVSREQLSQPHHETYTRAYNIHFLF